MFNFKKAFEPFHTDTAVVSGKRREDGVTRDLKLTVACCVLVGDIVDVSDKGFAAGASFEVRIEIFKTNWVDHLPPQKGDVVNITGYGDMTVTAQPFDAADSYQLSCVWMRV